MSYNIYGCVAEGSYFSVHDKFSIFEINYVKKMAKFFLSHCALLSLTWFCEFSTVSLNFSPFFAGKQHPNRELEGGTSKAREHEDGRYGHVQLQDIPHVRTDL